MWIHLIAGDTSGYNNIVRHMNGGHPKYIYCDCKCLFEDVSSTIPNCHLITSEYIKQARLTNDGLTKLCKKTYPMHLRSASKSPAPRRNEMIEPQGRFTVHFSGYCMDASILFHAHRATLGKKTKFNSLMVD